MSYNSERGSEVGEEKTETVLLRGFLLLVGQRCSDELLVSLLWRQRDREAETEVFALGGVSG